MNTFVDACGVVRGANDAYNLGSGQEVPLNMTNRGDQLVAMGLPFRAALAAQGLTWTCRMATGSAFTFVAAWPTTRAELILYNGEQLGGKSYIIDAVWMAGISSMGAAQPASILGQIAPVATVPTNDTAQLINGVTGKAAYSGNAKVAVANTAGGCVANKWDMLASQTPSPTTNLGLGVKIDLWGKYIVPPGYVFGLAGLAGTAAGTAILGVTWSEVQLLLG